MKVVIQKPDLDTCLTGLIMGVTETDHIVVSTGEASKDDLENPEVLCIEAGGSGDVKLNNFDHHNTLKKLPPACRQAFEFKGLKDEKLKRLVDYVCIVDERPTELPKIEFPSLSNIFSGMLLVVKDKREQFLKGIEILKKVLELSLDPFKTMPKIEQWREYIEAKQANIEALERDLKRTEFYYARNGYRVGFLESENIGGINALYKRGADVVVMFNPKFGDPPIPKWTIASKDRDVYHLVEFFNRLEKGWGGRRTIIGSPRAGTNLGKKEVLEVVLNQMLRIDEEIHIVTVGTSLINNRGYRAKPSDTSTSSEASSKIRETKDDEYGKTIESLNQISSEIANLSNKKKEAEQFEGTEKYKETVKEFVEGLKKLDIDYEMSLSFTEKKLGQNRFSQELTYVYMRFRKIEGKPVREKIYLLPTNSLSSKFSAEVTKRFIEEDEKLSQYFTVDVRPLEKIIVTAEARSGADLRVQANNVYEVIGEILRENQVATKVHIDIAGGLKSLAPYIVIQGMLHSPRVILHHVLPHKEHDTTIPVYPLGVDFHHFHSNYKRLNMVLEGKSWYEQNLSEQMKNLLDTERDRKQVRLSVLGQQFMSRYSELSKRAKLEVYSEEIINLLFRDVETEEAQQYRQILYNIIEKSGPYIWTGDKIPEMVEHARRHHHDLLEFTELLLTPILSVSRDFLTSEERFCLLAGILLHDCGHSIDYLETEKFGRVPLFASEIRDLHHLLSAQRLEDDYLRSDIGWISKEEFRDRGLKEELYDAVIDLCRYHRRKMPFTEGEFSHPLIDKKFPTLRSKSEYYRQARVDIMKLTSLLRIIDSLDIKSSRPGTEAEVRIALKLLERDSETLKMKGLEALELFKQLCNIFEKHKDLDNLKSGLDYFDIDFVKDIFRLKKNYSEFKVRCLEALKDSSDEAKMLARAWLLAAELIDRADMKRRQNKHYMKHQSIREVLVMPSEEFSSSNFEFDVALFPADNIEEELMGEIEAELKEEYDEIKKYLDEECGVRLKYYWRKANESIPFKS